MATDGSDSNEGSSARPFQTLRYALSAIKSGDTLMVKEGTYTGPENRDIYLDTGSNSGSGSGGFKNMVLKSEKGPEKTIFDAEGNGRHLTIVSSEADPIDSTTQIIGITFQGGQATQQYSPGGSMILMAGVENVGSENIANHNQIKFKNVIFKGNHAHSGGALHLQNAAPIFEDCVFENN